MTFASRLRAALGRFLLRRAFALIGCPCRSCTLAFFDLANTIRNRRAEREGYFLTSIEIKTASRKPQDHEERAAAVRGAR